MQRLRQPWTPAALDREFFGDQPGTSQLQLQDRRAGASHDVHPLQLWPIPTYTACRQNISGD